jgi:hypothetical protein
MMVEIAEMKKGVKYLETAIRSQSDLEKDKVS